MAALPTANMQNCAFVPPANVAVRGSGYRQIITSIFVLAAGMLLLVGVSGCGPRSDRLAISGRVTLDAVPLDSGSIRFTSKEGGKLFAAGAVVQNGEFHIPAEKGLPPGSYHVEMYAPDTKAPLVVYRGAPGQPQMPPTAPERIPPEYNVNSKTTVDVAADKDNHFEFDIVTRKGK